MKRKKLFRTRSLISKQDRKLLIKQMKEKQEKNRLTIEEAAIQIGIHYQTYRNAIQGNLNSQEVIDLVKSWLGSEPENL